MFVDYGCEPAHTQGVAEWPRSPAREESLESPWSRWLEKLETLFSSLRFFFFCGSTLNFDLCLLTPVSVPKKKKGSCQKVAVRVCQLINIEEKIVGKLNVTLHAI